MRNCNKCLCVGKGVRGRRKSKDDFFSPLGVGFSHVKGSLLAEKRSEGEWAKIIRGKGGRRWTIERIYARNRMVERWMGVVEWKGKETGEERWRRRKGWWKAVYFFLPESLKRIRYLRGR